MPDSPPPSFETVVTAHTALSSSAWELRLERRGLEFKAGELISLHGEHESDARDYTIASGTSDPELWILYRMVEHGTLTPQLRRLKVGDRVEAAGPYGTFTLRDPGRPVWFIATGTGIAPCVSFVRTHPDLDLTVLHGVRREEDLFYRELLSPYGYHPCVSGEAVDGFQGRVGERLRELTPPEDADLYLCGANEMIYEISDQLRERGTDPSRIFHEPYYYRADD